MAAHPNSLKNLRMYPPGVSGFTGRKKITIPEELRDIQSLSQIEVNKLISKYARMIQSALKDKLLDPNASLLELSIGRIFQKSIEDGDFTKLSFLLDRCIGKVPVIVETDDELDSREELAKLSMNELLTLVKALPQEIKE